MDQQRTTQPAINQRFTLGLMLEHAFHAFELCVTGRPPRGHAPVRLRHDPVAPGRSRVIWRPPQLGRPLHHVFLLLRRCPRAGVPKVSRCASWIVLQEVHDENHVMTTKSSLTSIYKCKQ